MTMKLRAAVAMLLIGVAGAAMAIQAPIASAAPTSTNVSCLPSTLQVGQTTTCVVNVTATGFFPFAPTGTVGMSSNGPGTFDGPCTLARVGGGATSQTSQCAVDYTPARGGPQTITAFFPGDANNTPSGDNTFITVTPRATTTTVSCSVSMIGVTGTCTATVTAANPSDPPPPSGTVFLSATSGTVMGTCFLSPTGPGTSACTVGYTPAQPFASVTAFYPGDASHFASQGVTTASAAPRTTTTTVVCTPSTFPAGGPTTCTATVRDVSPGIRTAPFGLVIFTATPPNGSFTPGGCSLVATGSDTSQCSTTYSSTVATTETIRAQYNGDQTHSGSSGTTTVTVTAAQPATLVLSPPTATNPVGTTHCVTATVTDAFGNPNPGVTVVFAVTGVNNPASATSTTGATGTAQYCYVGALAGTDTITAAVDSDSNGQIDATDQPRGTATKVWTLPASTQSCRATFGGRITAGNGDKATFGGNAKVSKTGDASGQAEYQDHGSAQSMNVKSINVLAVVCTSTTASIFGEATIDGSGTYAYRIDLGDNGEPGKNDTYRIQLSNNYDSGQQTLEGGNIQTH